MSGPSAPRPHETDPLTLLTLGGAGLYAGDPGELVLGPGKPLALLIYLALTPGRRVSRESLLDLLWADLEPERARGALRQVLFHLRRLLGESALPGSEELTLVRPLDTDRDRFLRCLERGELEQAVGAYTGAFLTAFGVPGGAAFEQWADLERDRLRAAFLRSAELLVRRQLNQSRFREAQRLARRVRDEAQGHEAAWRLVLETVVAGRDFVAASLEAEALEQWAAAEGVSLDPATRAAVARARQVKPMSGDPGGGEGLVAELTGREREFAAITAAWESARVGSPRHLHLSAPAGLGKTRLLRDAVARLRAGGAPVVEVRGAPGEREIPYAFAGELAVALAALPGATGIAPASAATLVALNPALSALLSAAAEATSAEDALRRRIQALTDLVQAVADEQPFVLVIDDLHWLDPASFRILDGLGGRFARARMLVLTASRPERPPPGALSVTLPLAPLTPAQVGGLVTALGNVPDREPWGVELVAGLHQATQGSPLLILETLRLALDQAILVLDCGEWRCLDRARLAVLLRAGEALRQRIRFLPREQGWLLALLATAGTPLSLPGLASATSRAPDDVTSQLGALEHQGLVMRHGEEWLPAHDEIATAARDGLDPVRQASADASIGGLLAREAANDPHRLLRAVRHFAAAGADREARQQFRRLARLERERGDRRPFAQLASEVLGEPPTAPRVRALLTALPRAWRLGLWSPARQAAALVAGAVALGGSVGLPAVREAREAALPRVVYLDSAGVATAVVARREQWDGRPDEVVPRRATTGLAGAALSFLELPPALGPDGRAVAWNQTLGDSTTIDIWIRTAAGTRRLTREARDDLVNSWVPDGSGLVGMSNRWADRIVGGYDIAVFDTATGAARQVTRGPEHDRQPFVSPDGTRIAFLREMADGPVMLCVVPFDGADEPDCRLPGGGELNALLGWSARDELVVTTVQGDRWPLVRYTWPSGAAVVLLEHHVYRPQLSPDRRWILAAVRAPGLSGARDWIIPVDQPSAARRVRQAREGMVTPRWWEGPARTEGLVERIEFADTVRTILPGVGRRLVIRALTAEGTEVPVAAPVRWQASDTLVAVVDSLGQVHPRGIGRVVIEASLAGWRRVRAEFEVRGAVPTTQVNEDWDESWRDRWITFGDPHPEVTRGPGGIRAFWNRGDGTYLSLAVLRRSFRARDGMGVEVRMSTPVTRGSWQRARVMLVAGIDTATILGADQRAALPSAGDRELLCGAAYPSGTGNFGTGRISLEAAVSAWYELGPRSALLRSGAWWTLRLQLLPDGRCGVAINGEPVWISSQQVPLDQPFWLRIGDESAGTRLLHGPLTVWTGVRTDIDWTRPPG